MKKTKEWSCAGYDSNDEFVKCSYLIISDTPEEAFDGYKRLIAHFINMIEYVIVKTPSPHPCTHWGFDHKEEYKYQIKKEN